MKEKRKLKQREIDDYKNVDGKKEELLEKMEVLENECNLLRSTLESTESAVIEAERRNDELIVINPSQHLPLELQFQLNLLLIICIKHELIH